MSIFMATPKLGEIHMELSNGLTMGIVEVEKAWILGKMKAPIVSPGLDHLFLGQTLYTNLSYGLH